MNKKNVMDTNIKSKKELPISLFSFLFSEIVQYILSKKSDNKEFDAQNELTYLGYPIGEKVLELTTFREKGFKRETKIVNMLQFIHNNLWKMLFNKTADGIQRSQGNIYEYRILETNPITNKFIPHNRNCSSFIGGIIEGFLNSAGFFCKVSAKFIEEENKTFYIIIFDSQIIEKDDKLNS